MLRQGVKSIAELIKVPGIINLDFADVTSVMKDAGHAHMGVGRASGKDKAEAAANAAISSPLLETTIQGAKGVIILISASTDITLDDVDVAATIVKDAADIDANIIFGVSTDSSLDDEMVVTVIATGFGTDGKPAVPHLPVERKEPELAAPDASIPFAPPADNETPATGVDDESIIDIFNIFKNK